RALSRGRGRRWPPRPPPRAPRSPGSLRSSAPGRCRDSTPRSSFADLNDGYARSMSRYASVYPLVTARAVARAFTYEVPDEAVKGAVVEVRFGNARRRGVVTETDVALPEGVEASSVERVAETLPAALVDLALWLADYYGSTPARALSLVAPYNAKRRGERSNASATGALAAEAPPAHLSDTQVRAL